MRHRPRPPLRPSSPRRASPSSVRGSSVARAASSSAAAASSVLAFIVVALAAAGASASPLSYGRQERDMLPVEAAAALAQHQALASAEAGLGGDRLAHFLKKFVLIKTPHGYILGRNRQQESNQMAEEDDDDVEEAPSETEPASEEEQHPMAARERRLPSLAESNFQLRVRKAPQAERNFQLRVRKRGFPSAENNFQLRVRKAPAMERNFQLRVRKRAFPSAENNFQLRVRRGFGSAAENNFQLRVRKGVMAAFPRVRKPSLAEKNFQLRVRKRSGYDATDDENEISTSALQDYLNRFKLLRTQDGAYILNEMDKRAAEGVDFLDEDVDEE